MKKLMHLLMTLGAASLIATPASANANYGNITSLIAETNGAVMFYHDGVRTTPLPTCAAGTPTRWAINASTVAGQGQVAVLLNAYNRGKQVYIYGLGVCSIWGDTETVEGIVVAD